MNNLVMDSLYKEKQMPKYNIKKFVGYGAIGLTALIGLVGLSIPIGLIIYSILNIKFLSTNNFKEHWKKLEENWGKLPQELKDKMNLLNMDEEKWKALPQEEKDKITKEVDEIYDKYLDPEKNNI